MRNAAEHLVTELLKDPVLVAYIAAEAIAEKVQSGELVPVERLTISDGLVLVPAERIGDLEARIAELDSAIDDAIDALDNNDVAAAIELLDATAEPGPDDEADEPVLADEPEPEPDEAEPDAEPEGDAPEPDPEPPLPEPEPEPVERDHTVIPDRTVEHPCAGDDCTTMVPGPTAQVTWVRFRNPETGAGLVLCAECLKAY